MMSYSVRNHTGFFGANYELNDKFSLFANVVFNDGRGSLGNLLLDQTKVPAIPPGFDYVKISEIGRFSALSIGRTEQQYGFTWKFKPNWVASLAGFHEDYDDRQPYLFDTNGSSAGFHGGISYIF
jgi:hypothetical protein